MQNSPKHTASKQQNSHLICDNMDFFYNAAKDSSSVWTHGLQGEP